MATEIHERALQLQSELSPKLSAGAALHLPSSEGFSKSNLRFTEYSRPVRARLQTVKSKTRLTVVDLHCSRRAQLRQ